MLNREDYITSICKRLGEAEHVPFKPVSSDGWNPEVAHCHRNVDKWVEANPGHTAVRGWVTYASFGNSLGLTAHSVVRDANGRLFDITPLENEYYRVNMNFISHVGDEQTFFAIKNLGICIACPDNRITHASSRSTQDS